MSTEQNKTLVRRYLEDAWGKGQTSQLQQFVERDVCDHNPMPGQPRGLEGQRWAIETFQRATPDLRLTLRQLVGEGDKVVDYWTCIGTQTGELFGAPPTGKRFNITGSDMYRIANGKIAEIWHVEDILSMMQQLGMAPKPPQSPDASTRSSGNGGTGAGAAGRGKTLSPEEKRAKIRSGYQEFIDKANPSAADSFLTPDFTGHFSAFPEVHGLQAWKNFLSMYNRAFSGLHAQVEDILVEGDFVACRATYTGKNTGEMMGMAPTGKQVKVESISLFRFAGDLIAEQWSNSDDLGMLQQMGVIPAQAEMQAATPC